VRRSDDPGPGLDPASTRIGDNGADAPPVKECLMAERDNRRDGQRRDNRPEENPEFADRLVAINRVSKTVKGGKRFGFAALVVVGDQRGRVGFGKGKAKEVPEAIRKATEQAKRSLIRVPLKDSRTLHHDMEGRHGAGKVVMRTAVAGTGIIAGGPMRAVFEMLGIQDVVAKSIGTSNPYNMIRATIDGLKHETSPRLVASRRGKKVAEILRKPEAETVEA
jgi:small subunit ribosomal protein S5